MCLALPSDVNSNFAAQDPIPSVLDRRSVPFIHFFFTVFHSFKKIFHKITSTFYLKSRQLHSNNRAKSIKRGNDAFILSRLCKLVEL